MTGATTRLATGPDVGIVLDRPDRSRLLAEALRQRGLQVTLYQHASGPSGQVAVPEGFLRGLDHIARRTRHDVYLTSACFVPAMQLHCNRRVTGRPYVFTLNGAVWQYFKDRRPGLPGRRLLDRGIYPFLFNRILGGADRIVCNSRYLRTALGDTFPLARDKSLTIYNGIDFQRYSGPPRGAVDRLISVTTLNNENKSRGVWLLVDAVERVLSARPGAHFTLAVKSKNPRHERELERRLAAHRHRDRVTLVYNHPDVASLLRASGLFLFSAAPDSDHSLPRALLEAQAVGLSAVTTATAGCAEIVQDASTGFTVPYDADALAQRALVLLTHPRLATMLGTQAAAHVRRTFSWDGMADQYRDVFLEALDRARSARCTDSDAAPAGPQPRPTPSATSSR
jgi:glycosyltransferase involved in cell wall biosynthesis